MPGLLDLPDELLIKVLSYLRRPYWPYGESDYQRDQRRKVLSLNRRIGSLVLAEWSYHHIDMPGAVTDFSHFTRNPGCQRFARELSWDAPYDQPIEAYDAKLDALIETLHSLSKISISSYEPVDIEYLKWDPNLLPVSLASLKQNHPSITSLNFVFSSFDMALALLEHLPNLQNITFQTHFFTVPKYNDEAHERKKGQLWHALCNMQQLQKLVWEGVDIMDGSTGNAGLQAWLEKPSKAPASRTLRSLDFGEYDSNYGSDHALFWQASAQAFPNITSLSLDASHVHFISDRNYFQSLKSLAVEDVCGTIGFPTYRDTAIQLVYLERNKPKSPFYDSTFLRHSSLLRLRIASSVAAYSLLKHDEYFPALRFLTISTSSEKWVLSNTPLLCKRIKEHCARRGVRLFEEVELHGKDLLFEYTSEEIDCLGDAK